MSSDTPCSACTWTPSRQTRCRYTSHIALFYAASDRGAWSLGTKYILKERPLAPPTFEAPTIRLLQEKTTIPVPNVQLEYEDSGRHFMITERVQGDVLAEVWATLDRNARRTIAAQTAEYLEQLRGLTSMRMQSLEGQPLYSAFLFPGGFGVPHGPFSSADELWAELSSPLKNLPPEALVWLRDSIPPAEPYTFTHGDLTMVNIIVKDGELAGIIDWEHSGYFPVWWEYTAAGITLGDEDAEWKALLRERMPGYQAAREWWLDLWRLRKYPDLDEKGREVLARLLGGEIAE